MKRFEYIFITENVTLLFLVDRDIVNEEGGDLGFSLKTVQDGIAAKKAGVPLETYMRKLLDPDVLLLNIPFFSPKLIKDNLIPFI